MQSTTIDTIYTPEAPEPIGPYSQAKRFGNLIFTAGQIGLDPEGNLSETVVDQTRRALQNLSAVLAAGGGAFESVIKTTIFLADMNDFAQVNEVYAEYFGDSRPARSTVEAAGLPKGALVEIEAIAAVI